MTKESPLNVAFAVFLLFLASALATVGVYEYLKHDRADCPPSPSDSKDK